MYDFYNSSSFFGVGLEQLQQLNQRWSSPMGLCTCVWLLHFAPCLMLLFYKLALFNYHTEAIAVSVLVAPGIFLMMFFKIHKLYNLIKREVYILTTTTTTTIKKNTQIYKVYNCLLWVFIFWNRWIIVLIRIKIALRIVRHKLTATRETVGFNWQ